MGFLKKLFGNVEKANKGEIPAEEIVPPFTNDLAEEADDYWRQMEQNLLINAVKAAGGPEAVERAVNENYEEANVPVIQYAMLQFETATMAWFGRKLTTASPEAQLTFEELVSGWRAILEQEVPNRSLDSDRPFPYFEV